VEIDGDKEISATFVAKGDLDDNSRIDLADAIIAIQVMLNVLQTQNVNRLADVNSDGKIGMEEAIFIMQKASGVR
jgi:hypothetical protein